REHRNELVEARNEAFARRRPQLARPRHEPHRGRDAEERGAAHLERLYRVRDGLCALEIPLDFRIRKRALIDDPHGTGRRPGDGLYAHYSAECGVLSAECKWKE